MNQISSGNTIPIFCGSYAMPQACLAGAGNLHVQLDPRLSKPTYTAIARNIVSDKCHFISLSLYLNTLEDLGLT